jgi:hypothetical protein
MAHRFSKLRGEYAPGDVTALAHALYACVCESGHDLEVQVRGGAPLSHLLPHSQHTLSMPGLGLHRKSPFGRGRT